MTDPAFSADGLFVAAVFAMTAVTYGLRMGGFWLMGRLPLTARVRRGLEALPGAIIISTILPITLQGGLVVCLALAVTILVQMRVGKDYIAVLCGAVFAAGLRAAGL